MTATAVLLGAAGTAPSAQAAAPGDGTVTVRVIRAVNANGTWDEVLEPGISKVTVRMTDDAGRTVTGTTGADGTVSFTPAGTALTGGRYRVQVVNPQTGTLFPALASAQGLSGAPTALSSNEEFVDVSGGKNISYTTGFWSPTEYCQENPDLVSCGLSKGDVKDRAGVMTFGGKLGDTPPGGTVTRRTATGDQGAVYGLGTDRTGNVFLGTYVKRHTEYGPAGAKNAIYRYNTSGTGISTFATLPGTLTAHTPGADGAYLADDAIYPKVGREGIGDVDVSGDGKTLYAVNLNDSKLYTVPVIGAGDAVTAGSPSSFAIPRPAAGCVGEWHPFGIGVRGKRVLVGGVCGAETTVTATATSGDPSKMRGFVFTFTGSGFTPLFDFGLDYPRGCTYRFKAGGVLPCQERLGGRLSALWEAWNERVPQMNDFRFTSAPQPMLSNIEISDNGDLVIALRDRYADMQGNSTRVPGGTTQVTAVAGGDLLRACATGGSFTLESNAKCGSLTGAFPDNDLGPGNGEFYNDITELFDAFHEQTGTGGTVLQPGYDRMWSTVFDPFDNNAFQQGAREYDNTDGSVAGAITLVDSPPWDAGLFGKGNGLADLELLCDQAPLQIGNRVWYDVDKDGIQDPGERPVPGATVHLYDAAGKLVGTTKTTGRGEYYFDDSNVDGGLKPDTQYTVKLDHPADYADGGPLYRWNITKADAGGNAFIDNKGRVPAGGRYPQITLTTGGPGEDNHTYDFGFFQDVRLTVAKKDAISGRALPGAVFQLWRETNGLSGLQTSGVSRDTRVGAACATDRRGRCTFDSLRAGATYYVQETAVPEGYLMPAKRVSGPYLLTAGNAGAGLGKVVTLSNKRGEPAKK
uniref:SdrD B-like domain-containing protein n=1 Tax=Streptomyces polyasparticus TaxID=2767826 RepID=UPI00280BF9AC|nr:SdrD B-like domain-containing protein [Streptomyces polyasparticus]